MGAGLWFLYVFVYPWKYHYSLSCSTVFLCKLHCFHKEIKLTITPLCWQKYIHDNELTKKTQVCSWISFFRKAKSQDYAQKPLHTFMNSISEVSARRTQHKFQSLADFFPQKKKKKNRLSYTLFACAGQARAIFLNDQSYKNITNFCAWAICFQIFWVAASYAPYENTNMTDCISIIRQWINEENSSLFMNIIF